MAHLDQYFRDVESQVTDAAVRQFAWSNIEVTVGKSVHELTSKQILCKIDGYAQSGRRTSF